MIASRRVTLAAFLCTLLCSAVVYRLVPLSTRDGVWTHNVLRNWVEYGVFKLGGKLVCNPGGHDAITQPRIITGHRAASLYLPYLIASVSRDVNSSGLHFNILLAALILGTIWHCLGRTRLALIVGCATVLSPGFIRCNTFFDPLAVPVLLGLPVMFWSREQLRRTSFGWKSICLLTIVLTGYSLLNWTAVFALAIFAGYLFVAPGMPRRNLFYFCGIAGAAATFVVGVSVLSKLQNSAASDPTLSWRQLYNAYLFGPGGYMGYPMSWTKAILRLVAANAVGLLPLVSIIGWILCRAQGGSPIRTARVLTPLFASALSIAAMRNYFAHHAWMAASLLIFGMIFSACIALVDYPGPDMGTPNKLLAPTFLAASFLYCCAVALMLRMNAEGEDALLSLIQQNTRRHDIIVVSRQTDALLSGETLRLSELFDRKIVVSDSLQPLAPDDTGEKGFLLSAQPLANGANEVARMTRPHSFALDLARKTLRAYRRIIVRRVKGDQLETEPAYYLFSLPKKQTDPVR